MNKKQKSGLRGAHLAAAELIRNGMNAFLTSRNSKGADIIVSDEDGIRQVGVQVKTNTTQSFFLIASTQEPPVDDRYFYVLVDVRDMKDGTEKIRYYVVPSKDLQQIMGHDPSEKFPAWLVYLSGKRKIPEFDGYENRWDLIEKVLKGDKTK